VTIVGYTDLNSRLAKQSSTLYATNLLRLTEELCKTKDGVINVNMEDDAIRGLTVIKEGAITWPRRRSSCRQPRRPPPKAAPRRRPKRAMATGPRANRCRARRWPSCLRGAALFWFGRRLCTRSLPGHFTVFVLACFIGYMVVWNVTPALHTPLMSVTNAISSIIAIGALVQIAPPAGGSGLRPMVIAGWPFVALVLTAINMFGGFAVTRACWRCSANKPKTKTREDDMSQSLATVCLHRRNHSLHPESGRPVQP
jgi:NAD(P) transhydrogenase subunit alpha